MVFLPKENENDLLAHLLKSPDQIHFVESRAPGGEWTRTLHVIPRAFTNAGLPATAVEDFVRDAKNKGFTVSHEPTFKANEWIKISGEPTAVAAFFETHRGVLETPPLHVLADRIEDVVERVLNDSPTPADPGSPPTTRPGEKIYRQQLPSKVEHGNRQHHEPKRHFKQKTEPAALHPFRMPHERDHGQRPHGQLNPNVGRRNPHRTVCTGATQPNP
jgi:hypothetical protein